MKGWKTVLVVVLQAAVYLFGWEQLTEYLDPQYIALISAILMLVLRMVTTTPVGLKK
jgi:hypothetical protein